jgi:hypothetical protein
LRGALQIVVYLVAVIVRVVVIYSIPGRRLEDIVLLALLLLNAYFRGGARSVSRSGVVSVWSERPKRASSPLSSTMVGLVGVVLDRAKTSGKPHSSNAVLAVFAAKSCGGVVPVWSQVRCQVRQQLGGVVPTDLYPSGVPRKRVGLAEGKP